MNKSKFLPEPIETSAARPAPQNKYADPNPITSKGHPMTDNPIEDADRFAALADTIVAAMIARGVTTTGELFTNKPEEQEASE